MVALAAPATPILKLIMNTRSRITFSTAEKTRKTSGSPAVSPLHAGRRKTGCKKNSGNDSRTDDHDVCVGILENIVRRVHQFQQTVHADHAESTDGYGKKSGTEGFRWQR